MSRHCQQGTDIQTTMARTTIMQLLSAVQSQKAVSAYFTSKQMLPFGFAEQCSTHWCNNSHVGRV